MEFKGRYMRAMRERAPKMFVELCRSGRLDEHVQEKSQEAHELLHHLLASEPKGVDGLPKDVQAERLAEERVLAQMLDFPAERGAENPESPEDVEAPASTASRLRLVK